MGCDCENLKGVGQGTRGIGFLQPHKMLDFSYYTTGTLHAFPFLLVAAQYSGSRRSQFRSGNSLLVYDRVLGYANPLGSEFMIF